MLGPVLEVPAVVREKALAVGAGGWLEALPTLVRSLEEDATRVGLQPIGREMLAAAV